MKTIFYCSIVLALISGCSKVLAPQPNNIEIYHVDETEIHIMNDLDLPEDRNWPNG